VVASGASQGFVVTGPAPGQTTCPPCTTLYSSANDSSSTAVIEENGPVRTVIKATGNHKDGSGNAYMGFTVRLYFYKGKSAVKVTSSLRNADLGGSNTFATAYKGHQGYELRLAPTLAGSPTYTVGNHTASPTTGTLTGSDSLYVYQGESQQMKWQDWCGFQCVPYTADTGYKIVKNGSTLASGTNTQYPQGWADLRDSNGAGISIGVYQLAAYWPKSLEFNAGGTDVRIGIWPRQNSQPYYQAWPQWSSHDLYLNFHSAALSSPANEFLKFQHYLVGRAPIGHYNSSKVFPYPLLDAVAEDAFYTATGASASPALDTSRFCCVQDVGTANPAWALNVYRWYAWNSGGGGNQTEFRWSYLLNFLTRGMTGRYLNAAHFYRHQADQVWPHSDGFNWRDRTGEYDGFGRPTTSSLNGTLAHRNWLEQEHGHWYGMTDFYFMTGDEGIKDALLDGTKDWFMNPSTYQNGAGGGLYNTRAVGVQLMGAARFSAFLLAIGDPDATTVLTNATNTYNVQVKSELCTSGYPVGCSYGTINDPSTWTSQGVSRTRGVHWGSAGNSGNFCGVQATYRSTATFMQAILAQGLLEFRAAKGPGWADYWESLDLAYGLARFGLSEMFADNGNGSWVDNGFRFGIGIDVPSACESNYSPIAQQTVSMLFYTKYVVDGSTDWASKFKINLQKDAAALGITTSDFGAYQIAAVAGVLRAPSATTLNDVPITGFTSNGGGAYTISWVVPPSSQSYRVKWGSKRIVDWLGFDAGRNAFIGDPTTNMPWFAATNVPAPPPAAAGTTQSLTINTGISGLAAANFSVKAYVGSAGNAETNPSLGSPGTAARLGIVSGNNQSGLPNTQVPQPLTVKVTDASGNAVSGVAVTFVVTAGGGAVSPTTIATDSSGLASTVLTLGSALATDLVTVGAGSLSGSPATFTAVTTDTVGISWVKQPHTAGWPAFNGFQTIWYDATSQQTLQYGIVTGSNSIYSSDMFAYRASANQWTRIGGNGTLTTSCSPGTSTWPGDRHPGWQMTIDTKRNVLWLFGGVCSGTNRLDMWYMQLRPDPMQNTWHQVAIAHPPTSNNSAAMVYDPDDDVIFLFGSDGGGQTRTNWVYCPTSATTTPGTLTAKQTAAGCATPDDWANVAVAGGVQPPGIAFPGLVYDTITKTVIQFGGTASSLASHYNETWAYSVPGRMWTRKALSTVVPPVNQSMITGQPAMAYNPITHKIVYHSPGVSPTDWQYDPVADTWVQLPSSGGGPMLDTELAYDASRNVFLAYTRSAPGVMEMWQGGLGWVPSAGTLPTAPSNLRIIR
jgi:hypothetical protein